MKNRYVLLGALIGLGLSGAAQAETQGFYIGAAGGIDFARNAKASTSAGENEIKYDAGPTGLFSVGYDFGAFRTELEGGYRTNDVSGVSGAALGNVGGRARNWSVMLNALYDIDTGTAFTPYFGGGIGAAFVDTDLTGTRPPGSAVGLFNGSETSFAYQGIVGASYALSPNLSLTADYHYFAANDASIKSGGAKWTVENAHHVVTAGLRWTFGAPPVAHALVVAPEPPAKTADYTVYFDWDKSNITPNARQTIAQAAAAAVASSLVKPTIALVTANTDTSGSSSYNQKLSDRRAAAVRQELIKQGVSADKIRTIGKGEDNPYVSTGDNVREQQNRRALIILRVG